MDAELVIDATCRGEGQAEALWHIAKRSGAARGESAMLYRHDISGAVSHTRIIREAGTELRPRSGRTCDLFGHLGTAPHYNTFVPTPRARCSGAWVMTSRT